MKIKYLCRKCRETFTLEELEEKTEGKLAKMMGFKAVFKCKCGSCVFEIHRGK